MNTESPADVESMHACTVVPGQLSLAVSGP
jgi:hypothetical protein